MASTFSRHAPNFIASGTFTLNEIVSGEEWSGEDGYVSLHWQTLR